MRAIRIERPEQWNVSEVEDPRPAAHEVTVAIAYCGVCGTDLHTLRGANELVRFPITPGHEFVGTVVEVGSAVSWLSVGQRIAVDPSRSCGHCPQCLSGRENLCPDKGGYGSRYNGGFAELAVVNATSCVVLPEGLPWLHAVLAEPLACVLHGLDRLGPVSGRDAMVFGAGPIGLLTALALQHSGARVRMVEPAERRRDFATGAGFDAAAAATEFDDPSADVTVDATGVPRAIEAAFTGLRRGGSLLMMGVAPQGATINFDPQRINWHELTILGSMAVNNSFERAVRLVSDLGDKLTGVVTHVVPLDGYGEAVDLIRHQGALKVVLSPHHQLDTAREVLS